MSSAVVLTPSKAIPDQHLTRELGTDTLGWLGYVVDKGAQAYNVAAEGAGPSEAGGQNTAAIQAALDKVGVWGGGVPVVITKPGTYKLALQGVNPYQAGHKYCLNIKYDYAWLFLGPGVVLKLDDGQQTDAGGPVDIIVFEDRNGILVAGAGFGLSRITGNTAGQPWTAGYGQENNGCIVRGYSSSSGLTACGVGALQLDDHFSDAVLMGDDAARSRRCYVRESYGFDCGEGFMLREVDDCAIAETSYEDPSDVAVGDAFELSGCIDFRLRELFVAQNGAGAAVDLYGSQKGAIGGLIVDAWDQAIQLGTKGSTVVDGVTISDGVINGCTNTSAIIGTPEGKVTFENIRVEGCNGFPFFVSGSAALPPVAYIGCVFDGNKRAKLEGNRTLILDGCWIMNGTQDGLEVDEIAPGDEPVLKISGGGIVNNATHGIDLLARASGYIRGTDLSGNGSKPINNGIGADACEKIRVTDCTPDTLETTALDTVGSGYISTRRFITQTGDNRTITTLAGASKRQLVTIKFTGSNNTILDKSDGGGDNLNLAGSANFVAQPGDTLTLLYDEAVSEWFEVSRSVN